MNTKAVLEMMKSIFSHKVGETVGIIYQDFNPLFNAKLKNAFIESKITAKFFFDTLKKNGFEAELFSYIPSEARDGVDAPREFYKITKDILIMPTVFSLTHTDFRKAMTSKGTRIASMPGFTERMMETVTTPEETLKLTNEVYEKMKTASKIRITGNNTDIMIEIAKVEPCPGMIDKKGVFDNLPGAEVTALPANANGNFTIPKGFGGLFPLKYEATFYLRNGRFFDIKGETPKAQEYIDKEVKPLVFGKENFDILAELGIGTNKNITKEYILKNGWSALLAEKIFGSAHFANGNNASLGGNNNVPVHIDWVVPDVKIEYL